MKGKDVYRLKLPAFFAKGKAKKKQALPFSWKEICLVQTGYDV